MSVEDGIPEQGQATPEATPEPHDWEKDYKALQAEYTRSQQAYKDAESVWEDEQTALARLQEKFPHLFEEEEPEPAFEPEEAEQPLTRAEFEQWQRQQTEAQQQQANQARFENDLKTFSGDRELSPEGDAFIRYRLEQGDFSGKDGAEKLKAAVDGWFEKYQPPETKPRPRVPHVPSGGEAHTGVPNYDGMTPQQIDKAMAERAAGMLQG